MARQSGTRCARGGRRGGTPRELPRRSTASAARRGRGRAPGCQPQAGWRRSGATSTAASIARARSRRSSGSRAAAAAARRDRATRRVASPNARARARLGVDPETPRRAGSTSSRGRPSARHSRADLAVDLDGRLDRLRPREVALDAPAAPPTPIASPTRGITQQRPAARRPAPRRRRAAPGTRSGHRRSSPSRPPTARGDHRQAARHRFQRDDALRLGARRQRKHVGRRVRSPSSCSSSTRPTNCTTSSSSSSRVRRTSRAV